jgi:hypothetical protein
MMVMKTKTFFIASLTINVMAMGALIFLLKTLLVLPDSTPAAVKWIFITNAPPVAMEQSPSAQAAAKKTN